MPKPRPLRHLEGEVLAFQKYSFEQLLETMKKVLSWRHRKLWYGIMGIAIILITGFNFREHLINNLGYIFLTKALARQSTENAKQAEILFERSLARRTDNSAAYRGLGFAFAMQGHKNEALEIWRKTQSNAPFVLMFWGKQSSKKEEYDTALKWYYWALELDETITEAWYQIGNIQHKKEEFTKALEAYRQAILLDEEESIAEGCHQIGKIQHELEQYEEAEDMYRKAISLGNMESIEALGLVFYEQKDFDEAKKIWQEALINFPGHSESIKWQRDIIFTLMAEKKWESSLKKINMVLKEYPNDPGLFFQKGVSLYKFTGDAEQSITVLKQAITLDKDFSGAYNAIGDIMLQEERYIEAITWYSEAIARNPKKYTWHLSRANAAFLAGDMPLALDFYQKTIEFFPNLSLAYYKVAQIYLLNNQSNEATTAIEKALNLADGHNLQYYLRAGNIYEQLGEKEKALQTYNQALTIDSDNKEAKQGIIRLSDQ